MANLDDEIGRFLAAAVEPNSRNVLTVVQVKTSLKALIADYADEYAGRQDELSRVVMWNIIAADADPARHATFVAMVLAGNRVQLVVGRGRAVDVRRFGDSEYPADPLRLFDELRARFPSASGTLELDRRDVDGWLNS